MVIRRLAAALLSALALLGLSASGLANGAPAQALVAVAPLAKVAPVVPCASLAGFDLSGVVGASAKVAAQEVAASGSQPAYCKVSATVAPAITIEVRLPMDGWSQRYLQTGCGGLCGNLRIDAGKAEGCAPVTDGSIVLASTDMGHQGNDTAWGDSAQQRTDFADRSLHVTALAAKALAWAFYGQGPRFSYFSGCSDGGREALIMAQRYPDDFDGIAAGAPALNFSIQNSFHHAWLARVNTGGDGQPLLTAPDMAPLHAAVLKACDGLDGLVDGQITDPRRCRFDPVVVQCKGAYVAGQCLTAAQVAAVRAIYRGAHTADGQALEVGPLQPGSEAQWVGVFVPRGAGQPIFSGKIALDAINHVLFSPNPATPYTIANFPFDAATLARLQPARAQYNADNADLSGFVRHGGKLILWHGWADPHISPINTIDYFDKVGAKMGVPARDGAVRLFLFPGMAHCSGGDGPSEFPLLATLMAWVEQGAAPSVMEAHRAKATAEGQPAGMGGPGPNGRMGPPPAGMMGPPPAGMMPPAGAPGMAGPPPGLLAPQASQPPRSRPVYAYPQVAVYKGSGSVDAANSFAAQRPAP
jgi:hypothetical protein